MNAGRLGFTCRRCDPGAIDCDGYYHLKQLAGLVPDSAGRYSPGELGVEERLLIGHTETLAGPRTDAQQVASALAVASRQVYSASNWLAQLEREHHVYNGDRPDEIDLWWPR